MFQVTPQMQGYLQQATTNGITWGKINYWLLVVIIDNWRLMNNGFHVFFLQTSNLWESSNEVFWFQIVQFFNNIINHYHWKHMSNKIPQWQDVKYSSECRYLNLLSMSVTSRLLWAGRARSDEPWYWTWLLAIIISRTTCTGTYIVWLTI